MVTWRAGLFDAALAVPNRIQPNLVFCAVGAWAGPGNVPLSMTEANTSAFRMQSIADGTRQSG